MALLRKITLVLLLAASAAVLLMAAWELLNYATGFSAGNSVGILKDRMDLLTKRVGDMELLVLILLGTSGLYAIVFVATSYFSATGFARQADQIVRHIRDQLALAMGDLRELQDDTEQRLQSMTAARVPEPPRETLPAPDPQAAGWQAQIGEITARLAALQNRHLSEHARLELVQDENTAAHLAVVAGPQADSALAALYLGFGQIYASSDAIRSRFYLERALRLAKPQSPVASEIHYQLACRLAASRDFPHAMRELTAAFGHQFKTLEERLANDIEHGGKLYELASTAPFDKAVNDLLLNMSIGTS